MVRIVRSTAQYVNGILRDRATPAVPQTQIRVRGRRRRHSTQAASREVSGNETRESNHDEPYEDYRAVRDVVRRSAGRMQQERSRRAGEARGGAWSEHLRIQATAESGFVYGLPIVENYAVQCACVIDPNSGQWKAPYNQVDNEHRVFTYQDTTVVTPNSDTP